MNLIEELQKERDECALNLKKLRQAVKGMEAKVLQTEAKLEMAEKMLAIAKKADDAKGAT